MTSIPLNSPTRLSPAEKVRLHEIVDEVLNSGVLFFGNKSDHLKLELSKLFGSQSVSLVGNGTDALEIALRALGVRPKSVVVTVGNAGGYSTIAIRALGAIPAYVDISRESLQMSFTSLAAYLRKASEKPACVVLTHLYGKAAPVEEISKLCREYSIPLVEDCAQAIGCRVSGRSVGSFGDLATVSFYPTKNLGALGDGGAVIANNEDLGAQVASLAQYGWGEKYVADVPGGRNSRMDELQAGFLLEKLRRLDEETKIRKEIYSKYQEDLEGFLHFPMAQDDGFVAHLGIAMVRERESFMANMNKLGVSTGIHYPRLDYDQPAHYSEERPNLPVSEAVVADIVTLPLFPKMTVREVERVVESSKQAAGPNPFGHRPTPIAESQGGRG